MSGATPAMMEVATQTKVVTSNDTLKNATMRAIRQSIQTDHLIALIALSIVSELLSVIQIGLFRVLDAIKQAILQIQFVGACIISA